MDILGPVQSKKKQLRIIADLQHGFFTYKQAVKCGYMDYRHGYHVKQKNWLKISTGLYRLPGYQDSMESDFTRWCLWSRNQQDQPQGVISHESALALHGLTEYDPDKIHMTISGRFQKKVPDNVVVHNSSLNLSSIESRTGFMVTRLAQTLLDMRHDLEERGRWGIIVQRLSGDDRLTADDMSRLGIAGGVNSVKADRRPEPESNSDSVSEGVWKMIYERAEAGRRHSRAGFTLVELLVVIAVISILASMLLPVLGKAMDNARHISCTNNLHQCSLAIQMYVGDNDGFMPPVQTAVASSPDWIFNDWQYTIAPYMFASRDMVKSTISQRQGTVYWCPAKVVPTVGSIAPVPEVHPSSDSFRYAMNHMLFPKHNGPLPKKMTGKVEKQISSTCLLIEGYSANCMMMPWHWHNYNGNVPHANKANVLYLDNHVSGVFQVQVPSTDTLEFWGCED